MNQQNTDTTFESGSPAIRWRSILSGLVLVFVVVLAPVAVLGSWAQMQLVDTQRFVDTFAPLADEPEIQTLVADQVKRGIEDKVDTDALVSDVFDGLNALNLPPKAKEALGLLETPAANGVRSSIDRAVQKLVISDRFSIIWENALRETHARTISALSGESAGVAVIGEDNVLYLELGPIIAGARQELINQGFGFGERIPDIDRSLPLAKADSFVLLQTLYQIGTTAGYWLPWFLLALFAAGVFAAQNRSRAISLSGLGLAGSLATLAAGIGIGRRFFINSVSPEIMPSATAEVIFNQITELMFASVVALIWLFLAMVIGAWLSGGSRTAHKFRSVWDTVFASIRDTMVDKGLSTGRFGQLLDRYRSSVLVLITVVGVASILLNRPASTPGVLWAMVGIGMGFVVVEVLRRPVTA